MIRALFLSCILIIFISCNPKDKNIPVIGFLELQQDETLGEATKGFFDALKKNGFSEEQKTIEVIHKNAQGDQIALGQACDYLISENVTLIATNPTVPTIAAVQKTKDIPIFMMVSPEPKLMGVLDKDNKPPSNLFGTFETLDYIDTAVSLIRLTLPNAKIVGTIFNQSEPQSVNALYQVEKACSANGLTLVKLPVNNSNEAQLVMQSLLTKNIDAFFAMPDNTVFSSLEVLVKACDDAKVPVFTCEEGLVKRGAIAGFGADMYQWGYQSGEQAALFLKNKSTSGLKPEIVKTRRKVYNEEKAKKFNLSFGNEFVKVI
jgi:putative ABC transport system substrate-binding protein